MNVRRHKVRVAAAGALALALAGCAGGETDDSPAAADLSTSTCVEEAPDGGPVAGVAVRDSLKGQQVTFAGYGGSFQAAQEVGFFKPFEDCTGATVRQDPAGASVAKLLSMQETGNVTWDVLYGTEGAVSVCDETVLQNLDESKLDTSQFLDDAYISECQMPVDIEPGYLVYDTAKFKDNPPDTITDFFNTQDYPGKRMLFGNPGYVESSTLSQVALALGYTPEEIASEFPLQEVLDAIEAMKDDIVFYQTFSESQQILESGRVVMGLAAAGRAYNASLNGAPIAPVWDGWSYGAYGFAVPVGAPNPEGAWALMNWSAGAEQQAAVTERAVYSPTNEKAEPDVPSSMADFIATPERLANGTVVDATISNGSFWLEKQSEIQEQWSDFITGLN